MHILMAIKTLRRFLAMTFVAVVAGNVHAQTYPNRSITLIYPYAPGSAADAAWRTIAQETGKQLGQSIIFDNRAGASGRIGADAVIKANKDGYTLGVANNALCVILPQIDPGFQRAAVRDYTPVLMGIETYLVWVAPSSAPFRDMKGLIAYAKANPGKLNAATSGVATGGHLGLEMLKSMAGLDITTVHYKGEAPSVTALLSGEVQLFLSAAATKPHVDSGKLIALATSGKQRWGLFLNLPTVAEGAALPQCRE